MSPTHEYVDIQKHQQEIKAVNLFLLILLCNIMWISIIEQEDFHFVRSTSLLRPFKPTGQQLPNSWLLHNGKPVPVWVRALYDATSWLMTFSYIRGQEHSGQSHMLPSLTEGCTTGHCATDVTAHSHCRRGTRAGGERGTKEGQQAWSGGWVAAKAC